MCADRLDNCIGVGMAWSQKMTYEDAEKILKCTTLTVNENGIYEISFTDKEAANKLSIVNDDINRLTHSNSDTYMMLLVSNIIKRIIFYHLL